MWRWRCVRGCRLSPTGGWCSASPISFRVWCWTASMMSWSGRSRRKAWRRCARRSNQPSARCSTPACCIGRMIPAPGNWSSCRHFSGAAFGEPGAQLRVREAGIDFMAPLAQGQKTGWFYDQAANRALLGRFLPKGARVLDVCSYVGAWAVTALKHGAGSATCVDASAAALEFAQRNAAAAGYALQTLRGDAFEALKNLHDSGARFDAVILDPPAFIKRRKDSAQGQAAYRKLNQLAMNLIEGDGLLVSC